MKQVPELPFEEFSSRIKFHAGGYDAPESYSALNEELAEYEAGKPGNRLFFLSVPPTVFGACSEMISSKVRAVEPAFTHLIIEKPFGRDTASFNELNDCTSSLFKESQLFRIDHYLGKEVVLNLVSLRFANQVYEPIWNKVCVRASERSECLFLFSRSIGAHLRSSAVGRTTSRASKSTSKRTSAPVGGAATSMASVGSITPAWSPTKSAAAVRTRPH